MTASLGNLGTSPVPQKSDFMTFRNIPTYKEPHQIMQQYRKYMFIINSLSIFKFIYNINDLIPWVSHSEILRFVSGVQLSRSDDLFVHVRGFPWDPPAVWAGEVHLIQSELFSAKEKILLYHDFY